MYIYIYIYIIFSYKYIFVYILSFVINYTHYLLLSTYGYIEAWEKIALSASSVLELDYWGNIYNCPTSLPLPPSPV